MMQDKSKCYPIHYGDAFERHMIGIYNLRITYPTTEIYLWDDDVSGAFRHVKYHPDIATAFAYTIHQYLILSIGQVFGSLSL